MKTIKTMQQFLEKAAQEGDIVMDKDTKKVLGVWKESKGSKAFIYDKNDTNKFVKVAPKHELAKVNEDGGPALAMGATASGGGGYTGSVGFATLSNTSGMGAPIASQPSSIPGDAAGATVGSGDIGSGWPAAKMKQNLKNDMQGKKRRNPVSDIYGSSSKRRVGKLTRGMKGKNKDGGVFLANDLGPKKAGKIKSFSAFTKSAGGKN